MRRPRTRRRSRCSANMPPPACAATPPKRCLHDKHFIANPSFIALRAEAMIRSVCQEPTLILEIPNNEQPGYIWSVLCELIDPSATDAALAERFDEAERAHLDLIADAVESPLLTPRGAGRPAPSTQPGEPVTAEPALPNPKETA